MLWDYNNLLQLSPFRLQHVVYSGQYCRAPRAEIKDGKKAGLHIEMESQHKWRAEFCLVHINSGLPQSG